MLAGTGSTLAWFSLGGVPTGAAAPMLKNMGGEPPGFGHRNRAGGFDILEHCRSLGLGAVRMSLPSTDLDAVRTLRKKIEGYGMRVIESMLPNQAQGSVDLEWRPEGLACAMLIPMTHCSAPAPHAAPVCVSRSAMDPASPAGG